LEIRFGDKNAAISLIHKIARREGFGNILAEGSIRAGKIIGADPDTTPSCGYGKDMDHGPIDCTSMAALTLANCVANRGAGHLQCTPPMSWGVVTELPEKWKKVYKNAGAEDIIDKPWICHPVIAEIVTYFEKINTSTDILEICKNLTEYYYFYGYEAMEKKDDLEWHAEWIQAVTGVEIDRYDIEKVTQRVVTLERSYNVREGKFREHDMPSRRFLQKRVGGPLDGKALDEQELNKLFDAYYEIHGWNPKTAIPTKKTLEGFGLYDVAKDFGKSGLFELEKA
jgi:aldehyde:ferredoxin oxidoreductase